MIPICGECRSPEGRTEVYAAFPSESKCPLCEMYYCSNQKCLRRIDRKMRAAYLIACWACETPHNWQGEGASLILAPGHRLVPNVYANPASTPAPPDPPPAAH